jgi:hypothetical protein
MIDGWVAQRYNGIPSAARYQGLFYMLPLSQQPSQWQPPGQMHTVYVALRKGRNRKHFVRARRDHSLAILSRQVNLDGTP